MSANDALLDAMRERAIDLARLDASERRAVVTLLKRALNQIVGQIAAADVGGDLTAEQRSRLDVLRSQIEATLDAAYRGVDAHTSRTLHGLAQNEAQFTVNAVNGAAQMQLVTAGITAAQLVAIADGALIEGAPTSEWWSRQSKAATARFTDAVRMGLVQGETNQQIIQRVRGTKALGYKDGAFQTTARAAEALVRSSVQAVANNVREAIYKGNEDVISGYQHISTLDDRTTITCQVRDGLRWTVDEKPIGHDQEFRWPPLHWNCRSTMVPTLPSWEDLGLPKPQVSARTRSAMDGEVPAHVTYETWLKRKGAAFQDRVLGPGRAELWRQGRIGFRDLVDQTGRPLTLQELEDKLR